MSISIQAHHPYTGHLNSETPGDRKHAFLHCGDVLGHTNAAIKMSMTEEAQDLAVFTLHRPTNCRCFVGNAALIRSSYDIIASLSAITQKS